MDPELLTLIERRAAAYRAIQDRAGVSFRCLDPGADDSPAPASVDPSEDDGRVIVRIQGPLDWLWGFDYRQLISDLDAVSPEAIHLLIGSPGGFLSDGLALYSDLRARARDGVTVTSEARGVVASAAVLPFLAADERTMTTGTELMVHEPWSFLLAIGTADEIEDGTGKLINGLRAGEKTLRDVMVERTAKSRQQVSAWLKAETWFTPDEAVEAGFATAVTEDHTAAKAEQDTQARALARRVLTNWRLKLRQEEAA